MRQKIRVLSLLLVMFLVPLMTYAQNNNPPAQLLINYPEVSIGTGDRTALGLYFTILDRNGVAVSSGGSANNASIVMDTGTRYDAQISQPNTPLHISLVLDISGSMGPFANDMKTAAIQAIEAAPAGTLFQVIAFNRQINLLQNFTSERTAVINAIASANPPPPSDPNAGTCLYDATIQALAEMDSIPLPNRRTIVLFTDGRDELTTGRGDKCSRASLEDVLNRATRLDDRIAINTIGLGVAINGDELRDVARQTGGISVIGEQARLSELFGQIINGLASQQVARTEICEPAGARSATLTVQVGGGLLTSSITFQNARGCAIATQVPVALIIRGVRFDDKAEKISFTVEGQGLSQIAQYSFEIYDGNGNLVGRFDQPTPNVEFDSFNIPDGQIEINLVAFDSNGLIVAQIDQDVTIRRPTAIPTETPTPTPQPTITPTPPAVSATITGIEYIADTDSMNVNLLISTPDQISRVEVDVVDRNGILAFSLRPPVEEVVGANLVTFSITNLIPQAQYTVQVRTFNQQGQLVSTSDQNFTNPKVITPTPSPTATPQVSASVDTIVPDLEANRVVLQLDVQSPSSIGEITIDILDRNNTLVRSGISLTDGETEAVVDLTGLEPEGEYRIRVVTRDNAGNVLSRETTEFTNPIRRILTPTPSPTPAVAALIDNIRQDERQENFVIDLRIENSSFIATYRLDIVDDDQGNLVSSTAYTPEEVVNNQIIVPIPGLPEGQYRLRLVAQDTEGRVLSENIATIGYTPNTPTPTPTPPGFTEQLSRVMREQPIVAVIIVIIILLLIFLLFWLIRSARKRDKDVKQPSLPNMTGAISINELRQGLQNMGGYQQQPPYGTEQGTQDFEYGEQPTGSFSIYGDATNMPSGGDPNATNFQIMSPMSAGLAEEATNVFLPATLNIIDSLDTTMIGKTMVINRPIFLIGRAGKRQNDMNIEGDKNISREHADIIFDGGAYYIESKPNTHGVRVNDEKIEGRYPLGARAIIKLGETTVIEFTMTTSTSKTASFDEF